MYRPRTRAKNCPLAALAMGYLNEAISVPLLKTRASLYCCWFAPSPPPPSVAGPASRVLKTRAPLYCCWLPLLQDRPLGWVAAFPLPYLAAGTTRVLTDGRTQTPESCPDSIWSYIAKEGVTFAHLTPQVAGYSGV